MDPRVEELDLRTFFRAVADFVMPRVCVVCGTRLLLCEDHICACCLAELPETHFSRVSHNPMADAFNARIAAAGPLRRLGHSRLNAFRGPAAADGNGFERYCHATALFYYNVADGYDNITQVLKYRRDFSEGKWFARLLGRRMAESNLYADVDMVVPVPLHWTRHLKRGYNQAGIIAREVADALGAQCSTRLLKRRRRTKSQAYMGARKNMRKGEQRMSADEMKAGNVAGAFTVRKNWRGTPQHILLVDDVFTTGSTMQACHSALRERFGTEVRISVATLAYVNR